jgi:hypothetical protein
LIDMLDEYLDRRNEEKSFIWTAKSDEILAKTQRARTALYKRFFCVNLRCWREAPIGAARVN